MKLDRFTQTAMTITAWVFASFIMSIIYYYLKDMGMIWDNPSYYMNEKGEWETVTFWWNTRKMILITASLCYTFLAGVKIASIIDTSTT